MTDQLRLRGAEHSRVVENHPVHLTYAAVGIEEHDEEHYGHAEGHLGPDAEAEPQEKDWRQHYAGQCVGDADVRLQQG